MQRHGLESPHHSPSAEARDGAEVGAGDAPGQPRELLGVPGVVPGLGGPGETGRTPLPTSTASGEAPPSTGVSGASSSRSVARLYSTICQTVGAPTQVRQRGLRAHGPAPAPLACSPRLGLSPPPFPEPLSGLQLPEPQRQHIRASLALVLSFLKS